MLRKENAQNKYKVTKKKDYIYNMGDTTVLVQEESKYEVRGKLVQVLFYPSLSVIKIAASIWK